MRLASEKLVLASESNLSLANKSLFIKLYFIVLISEGVLQWVSLLFKRINGAVI